MYQNFDVEYEIDLDDNIQRKEALLKEAKELPEHAQWNEVFRDVATLKRKWRAIPFGESAYEESLEDDFNQCLDVFYAKRKESFQNNQQFKQELVKRAQEIAKAENLNQASDEMNELMNQWKAIGSAGKENDDILWVSFQAARQSFYENKQAYWEEMKSKFTSTKEIKQGLIQEAAMLCDSEDYKETSTKYNKLMEQWKLAGSAGREHDDALWNEFNEIRQKFYDRRASYYEEIQGQQDTKYSQKQALIEKAQSIAQQKEYTKEYTAQMKELNIEWKKIGSCGKGRENETWTAFRMIMDGYFAGLKAMNEKKHAQWKQNMLDARARKLELIQGQKRQIQYLQQEMVGLLGERAIQEMEDEIADKEDFIKELEEQLKDIEKSLQE